MANTINNKETITLQDGTKVEIKPLTIKNLRKFMDVIEGFDKIKDEKAGLDLMIDAVQIALVAANPEKFKDKEYLEDVLDMPTISKIMEIAGGVDINADPNLGTATA